MLAVGLAGVGLGASYWAHYLVGLIPALTLAIGSLGRHTLRLRRVATTVVVVTVTAAVAATAANSTAPSPSRVTEATLERLLSSASHSHDTAAVTYGHPNLIEGAGLLPGYPYLWSLPMRTLDPRLDLLNGILSGSAAPTWLIEWEELNSWQIDTNGRLAATIETYYRPVATVCDVTVLLHRGVDRSLPATADPCAS